MCTPKSVENFRRSVISLWRPIMIALVVVLLALVALGMLCNRPGLNFYARELGSSGRYRER